MFTVERLPDGRLRVPVRLELPGGGIGDGTRVIDRDDPEWAAWLAALHRAEEVGLA